MRRRCSTSTCYNRELKDLRLWCKCTDINSYGPFCVQWMCEQYNYEDREGTIEIHTYQCTEDSGGQTYTYDTHTPISKDELHTHFNNTYAKTTTYSAITNTYTTQGSAQRTKTYCKTWNGFIDAHDKFAFSQCACVSDTSISDTPNTATEWQDANGVTYIYSQGGYCTNWECKEKAGFYFNPILEMILLVLFASVPGWFMFCWDCHGGKTPPCYSQSYGRFSPCGCAFLAVWISTWSIGFCLLAVHVAGFAMIHMSLMYIVAPCVVGGVCLNAMFYCGCDKHTATTMCLEHHCGSSVFDRCKARCQAWRRPPTPPPRTAIDNYMTGRWFYNPRRY
eukprot:GDKI01015019.1.p1 GENE.GDKI01015019.1~~GDKI01015019.1.p1  ORF type:complete len:377 (+),score=78.49 GDKI01015019.1:127-1131(+)